MAFTPTNSISIGTGANAGTFPDIYFCPRDGATITRTNGVITDITYATAPVCFGIRVQHGFVKPKFEQIDGFRTFKQSVSFPVNAITAAARKALLDAFDGTSSYFVIYRDAANNGSVMAMGVGEASISGFGKMVGLTRDAFADGGSIMVTIGHADNVGEDTPFMPVQFADGFAAWTAINIKPF